ncbi:MAG: hypothetical protein QW220_01095 [Candidatus Bathyarchaeia archaeon]
MVETPLRLKRGGNLKRRQDPLIAISIVKERVGVTWGFGRG